MCGNKGFFAYCDFLNFALIWLDSKETIYEFMSLGDRLHQTTGVIFGLDVRIVLFGTYAQIEQEILNFKENK